MDQRSSPFAHRIFRAELRPEPAECDSKNQRSVGTPWGIERPMPLENLLTAHHETLESSISYHLANRLASASTPPTNRLE